MQITSRDNIRWLVTLFVLFSGAKISNNKEVMAEAWQKQAHYCALWWFLGQRTGVAANLFWSFFWLLDVMPELSWEILLDEAVKEGSHRKRGNTRMSRSVVLWARGDWAAADIKGKWRQAAGIFTNKQWDESADAWFLHVQYHTLF